jgi:hypothetical protein
MSTEKKKKEKERGKGQGSSNIAFKSMSPMAELPSSRLHLLKVLPTPNSSMG